ncbi:MAG TPA: PhnD/SsuA/transferrin family substrate-binding protein [Chloroflexi bacterium]|nr:PhnD/SsuA/transferrin family substrate-binding protein [Chloroflexota bacterium]
MKKLLSVLLLVVMVFTLSVAVVGAAPPNQDGGTDHTVQKDDWLSKLADKFLGDLFAWPAIWEATNAKAATDDSFATIDNPNIIEVGQKLYIPSPEEAAVILGAQAPAAGELGSPEKPIQVLFVPSVDAGVIVTGGEVMADALNKATGLNFEVSVPTSYAATVESICASPDDTMAFIPALGYVLANTKCNVGVGGAAVRYGLSWYTVQYMVARDSGITSLEDLAGKKWAVPDRGSTSGFLYPTVEFQSLGVEPGEVIEAGGHGAAVLAVYNGEVDFGTSYFSPPRTDPEWVWGQDPEPYDVSAVVLNEKGKAYSGDIRILDARASVMETAPDVIEKVGILTLGEQIPNDTVSFGPEFPADMKTRIMNALPPFMDSDECQQSICSDEFYGWTGVEPVGDSFYDPVRQLIDVLGYTEEDVFGG